MPGIFHLMYATSSRHRRRELGGSPLRLGGADGRICFFMEDAFSSAVEVVVLPGLERPHERRKASEPEAERDRYQVKVVLHSAASSMAGAGIEFGAALAASPSLPLRRS